MVRYRTTAEQRSDVEAAWQAGLDASAVVRYLTMTRRPVELSAKRSHQGSPIFAADAQVGFVVLSEWFAW